MVASSKHPIKHITGHLKITPFIQYALIGPKWKWTHKKLCQQKITSKCKTCIWVLQTYWDFILIMQYHKTIKNIISQSKPYMQYFHPCCELYVDMGGDKCFNHGLMYCLKIQFQFFCNIFILFLLTFFSIIVGLIGVMT